MRSNRSGHSEGTQAGMDQHVSVFVATTTALSPAPSYIALPTTQSNSLGNFESSLEETLAIVSSSRCPHLRPRIDRRRWPNHTGLPRSTGCRGTVCSPPPPKRQPNSMVSG